MSRLLFVILIVMGAAGYVYYGQTQRALAAKEAELQTQRNLLNAFEMREAEQQKTIDALQNNLQKTTESLNKLSTRNAEIEAEAQRYLAIFARHNLAKLAAAKPGLIETRINKGTSDVFRTIEKDSAFIDSIDD
jgi:septal ring factor EnvC (AmiA/AmiB activator)